MLSFWRIICVMISMFGAYILDTTRAIADNYYVKYSNDSCNKLILVPVMYPAFLSVGTTFLCILMLRLIYAPFLSRYLPRLLTRMGMGLFIALCTSCSLTLLSMWQYPFPYDLITIAIIQVLYGCFHFFTLVTSLEFIIAQSPLRMQGLLIGIWFCQIYLHYGFNALWFYITKHLWQYLTAKTVLIFLSCLIFLITGSKYKYRERNEITDVNERLVIAEYHERQLLSRDDEVDTSDDEVDTSDQLD